MKRQEIVKYKVRDKSTEDLIADAQKMQKWINGRIDAVTEEGIPKNATIGRLQKKPPSNIHTIKQAERVIAKAKELANNPLTDVRNWRKLITAAEKEYGKGRRWKIINDPSNPRKPKLVPYGSNKGNKFRSAKEWGTIIGDFWEWYWKIAYMFFDSDQADMLFSEAMTAGIDPIEHAEEYIYSIGEWEEYILLFDQLYNTDRASEYL